MIRRCKQPAISRSRLNVVGMAVVVRMLMSVNMHMGPQRMIVRFSNARTGVRMRQSLPQHEKRYQE